MARVRVAFLPIICLTYNPGREWAVPIHQQWMQTESVPIVITLTIYNQLQILTLPSQYIFSLLIFVVKNKDLFLLNSDIHSFNTCNNSNLHIPGTNLTIFQKGVLYSGRKIYNKLPPHTKSLSNNLKRFKSLLKGFLMEHTLYSTDEFYQITWHDWFLPM